MMWYWEQYTTDANERNQITISPLRANREQLKGLPPALVIAAEVDVLRGAGVHVTVVRFQGIIHDFVMLNPLANTTSASARLPSSPTG